MQLALVQKSYSIHLAVMKLLFLTEGLMKTNFCQRVTILNRNEYEHSEFSEKNVREFAIDLCSVHLHNDAILTETTQAFP